MTHHHLWQTTRLELRTLTPESCSEKDSLKEPLPTSDNGLGWVQIQQKSLRWEEHIQDSTIITHEGLTTLAHPNRGWTITSGTWNTLRAKWGLTSETLQKIYDSCKIQRQLETANIFTPTRHILQTIKRVCKVEGIHGLPSVTAPTFFPKASKNKDIWWETKTSSSTNAQRDENENESGETEDVWDPSDEQEEGDTKTTAYLWDSMDEEDRKETIDILQQSDEWVIWKSKDKWSAPLKTVGFHQLLYIKKDTQEECWGSKIKYWLSLAAVGFYNGGEQETSESKNRKRRTKVGLKTRQKYHWEHRTPS
jgi:hypothetical protein